MSESDTFTSIHSSQPSSGPGGPIPAIVYLSGERRGTTLRLRGDRLTIGTAASADIRIQSGKSTVAEFHAYLTRRGASYELESVEGAPVWVNGEAVDRLTLASGDVLEVGRGGPALRFRLYPPGSKAFKSVAEAFDDCLECARFSAPRGVGRAAVFLSGAPRELLTQTAPWFRVMVLLALAALITSTAVLAVRARRLERQVAVESGRLSGIAELLDKSEREQLRVEDLEGIRQEVAGQLTATGRRLQALEARSEASSRVIGQASQSVIFLQGAYGFVEPKSRRPLRFSGLDSEGRPLLTERGDPTVGLDGSGPPIESLYTGTAFVAGPNGQLMTNRHVALPWDYADSARRLQKQGLVAVMRRFVGYLPGIAEPFDVELLVASDTADVAVLRSSGVAGRVAALEFAEEPPSPGDEVLVLGYPTGMRALLARAERSFVRSMLTKGGANFWSIAQQLAGGGRITPLASRGIVGQVTSAAVVYDAETTQGGSGGPVLDLDGRVVAVNAAIMPGFGGSNLGVPAAHGRVLIQKEDNSPAAPSEPESPARSSTTGF